MSKKLEKWSVKLCVLTDFVTKYVYNFEVYCGKNARDQEGLPPARGELNAAYTVVMGLLARLEGQGHCLVLDNFFGSIQLFKDLVGLSIYTTSKNVFYFSC